MELESLLGLIGLARRAGKLAVGEALTAELVAAGRAVGFPDCAVCAMQDIGMAQAAAKKFAGSSEENRAAAARVFEKKTRIDRRKGVKKDKRSRGSSNAF